MNKYKYKYKGYAVIFNKLDKNNEIIIPNVIQINGEIVYKLINTDIIYNIL